MVRRVFGVWANAATSTRKIAEIDRVRIPHTISPVVMCAAMLVLSRIG
jgi:tRNA(Arg) A34 adenosine deaminase TadA